MPAGFGTWFEPFLGGGAAFLALRPRRAVLSDLNAELIHCWRVVRDAPRALMEAIDTLPYGREEYYAVRGQDPAALGDIERAARLIYLNKTGFNGLYRVNRSGRFNVPFGRRAGRPRIYDRDNLLAVSEALSGVALEHGSFETRLARARAGDFVYCDPPYQPLSATAKFTSYTEGAFSIADQGRLAALARDLARRGCTVVVSNSDTPEIRALYDGFQVERVMVSRPINSRADRRGAIGELLIVGEAGATPARKQPPRAARAPRRGPAIVAPPRSRVL